MLKRLTAAAALVAVTAVALALATGGGAAKQAATPTAFSNTPLIATWQPPPGLTTSPIANSTGDSEPAIAFGGDGRMAVDGLAWLPSQVNLWTGRFGSTPSYFGGMDQNLQNHGAGRTTLGDGDADVEFTSAGTILLADLDFYFNPNFNALQLGVSVTRCPKGATGPSGCTTSYLDQSGADREWITTYGQTAWVAYHDAQNSTMIRVKKSTDDGRTWHPSGSPLVGQGDITGNSTFNSSIGPIVADPTTGYVYSGFTGGEQQTKCCSAAYNNVYVARSTDGGDHYTAKLVYHAAPFTDLANFWPATAVDSTTGQVWVAWTDRKGVYVSTSTDHGDTWAPALKVSGPATATTVMPWVAARGGKVDVVYYGSAAPSVDDASAVWNAYDSQLENGKWSVKLVSNTPVRFGKVCLNGSACTANRELLDLFEVAEDPASGKAAVIYSDTTMATWTGPDGTVHQLPEIVLAYEK
jgi:hypothetical protein